MSVLRSRGNPSMGLALALAKYRPLRGKHIPDERQSNPRRPCSLQPCFQGFVMSSRLRTRKALLAALLVFSCTPLRPVCALADDATGATEASAVVHAPKPHVFGDDRDKALNPRFGELGKDAMPIGRERTEDEVRESIVFARSKMLEEFPAQARLIQTLAAIEFNAINRTSSDKSPKIVLQGLPGTGKTTAIKRWFELRDKAKSYRIYMVNEKMVEFPADAIFRSGRRVIPGESPKFYDGLDAVFVIDELDKALPLSELKREADQKDRQAEEAIQAQIDGQRTNINAEGGGISPEDLQKFDDLETPYLRRMRSLNKLWTLFDKGVTEAPTQYSKYEYIQRLDELANKISAADINITALTQHLAAIKAASSKDGGGSDKQSSELKEVTKSMAAFKRQKVSNTLEVYKLFQSMRVEYPNLFTADELKLHYRVQAEQFVMDPEKANSFTDGWKEREPNSGRGPERDMRGVMTVVSMNSALLRDLRERYGKRAVPVTPEDAEEIVKAYEKIFQRELKELFGDTFTNREGSERRFGLRQFLRFQDVSTREDWMRSIRARLDDGFKLLKANQKKLPEEANGEKLPELEEVEFDPSVEQGLYNLTEDGFQGWDSWRDSFTSYTREFFSELSLRLRNSPVQKLKIKLNPDTGTFEVTADGREGLYFEYQPNGYLDALNKPKVANEQEGYRRRGIKAARDTVGTGLMGSFPASIASGFRETGRGYGIRARWFNSKVSNYEYNLNVALAEMAGFVWQRTPHHGVKGRKADAMEVDDRVAIDFIRSFNALQEILEDTSIKKYVMDRLQALQGRRFLFWSKELKNLDEVIPYQLKGTIVGETIKADPDLTLIFQQMYGYVEDILVKNERMARDLANFERVNGPIDEANFKEIFSKDYMGGRGMQETGRILKSAPGAANMQACLLEAMQTSLTGQARRWIRKKVITSGQIRSYWIKENVRDKLFLNN
jgi:hypothetical protein